MLDTDTKRRIDSCRDILVGKVPDPKSQVEQITIALIYKFMDDMDSEAEEFGGTRTFFAGEFSKYSWAKLMAPNMGGFDVLALYSEAIQKMNENPNIPPLFRDIFKNAYLPYRDPETLRAFLKEIDGFTYDHSEKLGDAFEYLLSVLGSQGDAGQFRTPRHIIDFMVEIVDPKKDETIGDNACGTAGFLISAYKHILKHNSKDYGGQNTKLATYDQTGVALEGLTLDSPVHYKGDLLTPDERKRLSANIKGYDISPDMVRLSLVNLYLHGFTDPHIYEYDTLTSEERWNEYFDVIFANPPFMSPKGGIKPHKRFSVQSNRSEVLFVDYIAEHLTPNGRAAIVVPEGIIFQSGTAYKALREMLVKNYLVAVISLPAGVFNPYSGVKTSILILDKRLSKKADSILFAKIDNDGFNLGAQRRPIDKNDLPTTARHIKAWLQSVQDGQAFDVDAIANLNMVTKEKIAENGEWNLSGERYQTGISQLSHYEMVTLSDVANLYQPKTITSKEIMEAGPHKVFGANGVIGYFTEYNHEEAEVLITCRGATCGTVNMSEPKSWVTGNAMVAKPRDGRLNKNYLFYFLKNIDLSSVISGAAQPQITRQSLAPYQIPLPPIDVQKEIVAEIEGYQKIIDGARQVVENYKPRIQVDPDWPMVELGDILSGKSETIIPSNKKGTVNYIGLENIESGTGELIGNIEEEYKNIKSAKNIFLQGSILYGKLRPNLNKVYYAEITGVCSTDILVLSAKSEVTVSKFYSYIMRSGSFIDEVLKGIKGAQLPRVSWDYISKIIVPAPDADTQSTIVAQIEEEQRLVSANKELIGIFEDKIKATINRVWGGEG